MVSNFEKTVDLFLEVLVAQLALAAKDPSGEGVRKALRKALLASYEAGRKAVIGECEPDAVVEGRRDALPSDSR